MGDSTHSLPAVVDVQRRNDVVDVSLELPLRLMSLALTSNPPATNYQNPVETEADIIVRALQNIDFIDSSIGELRQQRWAVLTRCLHRLTRLNSAMTALKSLLMFRGLWGSISVCRLQFLVEMAEIHEVLVAKYLNVMAARWTALTAWSPDGPVKMDTTSINLIAGLWPQANHKDRTILEKLFTKKTFFPAVTEPAERAGLHMAMLGLDGRMLTFEIFFGQELRLL
jgi:hypothetical protein